MLILLAVSDNAYAQLQPPPPTPGEVRQPPQSIAKSKHKKAATDQRGTEQEPLFIKGLVTTKQADEEAAKAKQEQDEKSANESGLTFFTGELAFFTKLLFFIAVVQAGLFFWQLFLFRQSLIPAEQAARAAFKSANTIEAAERAYVKMSHLPPGLTFDQTSGIIGVNVEVKNFGRTPARITNALLTCVPLANDATLPVVPNYVTRGVPIQALRAFLVTEDHVSNVAMFRGINIADVMSGTVRLTLYGYVDYIDQFGQRHRAGYGRVYDHRLDDLANYVDPQAFSERSNLTFLPQEGYNYDRPRQQGEGNDWQEPTT